MGRSTERMQDSQHSVWSLDTAESEPAGNGWLASLTGWHRRSTPEQPPQVPPQPAPVDFTAFVGYVMEYFAQLCVLITEGR